MKGLASDLGLASGPIPVSLLQDPPTHFPCLLVTPVLPHTSWPAFQTAQRFLVHGKPCQLSGDSEVQREVLLLSPPSWQVQAFLTLGGLS